MITVAVLGCVLQKRLPPDLPRSLLGASHSASQSLGTAPDTRSPSSYHLEVDPLALAGLSQMRPHRAETNCPCQVRPKLQVQEQNGPGFKPLGLGEFP